MDRSLAELKNFIIGLASEDRFIHHKWFVRWHLEIVEKISLELCEIYTNANRDIVLGLVWMHDFEKISGIEDTNKKITEQKIAELLKNLGFEEDFITKLQNYLNIFESKMTFDLKEAPIEVQIVSSADGASHLTGPFMQIYLYENNEKPIEELLESNLKKLEKDWQRKIVLREVKRVFRRRYEFLLEQNGKIPSSFKL